MLCALIWNETNVMLHKILEWNKSVFIRPDKDHQYPSCVYSYTFYHHPCKIIEIPAEFPNYLRYLSEKICDTKVTEEDFTTPVRVRLESVEDQTVTHHTHQEHEQDQYEEKVVYH